MHNPLLETKTLPLFKHIKPEHALPAIKQIIEENKAAVQQLEKVNKPSWDTLVQPLEDMENRLSNAWAPIGHLNSVCNSDALREQYQACLQLLSAYQSELGQNEKLYQLFCQLNESDEFATLSEAQQKIITDSILHFKLAGVGLSDANKKRYRDIQQKLAELTNKFENNVLDATDGWYKHVIE